MTMPSNSPQPPSMLTPNSDNYHLQSHIKKMKAMVANYSLHFPRHECKTSPGPTSCTGMTVLVTGTTGALGCYILDFLVKHRGVAHVYALNRPGSDTRGIVERQTEALIERGLDSESIFSSGRVDVLEADVNVPGFGIPSDIYNKILRSTTHIIHNAWPVIFNRPLAKFEDNVKGLRNLIDFALSSPQGNPIKFVFVSSIGVFQNVSMEALGTNILEQEPVLAEAAASNGYTESKWVAEQILANAAKYTNLPALVVRVGQLTGGINGCWNTREWFPTVIKLSTVLQCIPTHHKIVSWIPVNLAAGAIVDYLSSDFKSYKSVHLTHPNPVPWNVIACAISQELSVPLVLFSEWCAKLEQFCLNHRSKERDNKVNLNSQKDAPLLGLLPFIRKGIWTNEHSKEELCSPSLQNVIGVSLSSTLSNPVLVGCLSESDVRLWIGYWRRKGLLKKSDSDI